jgi:hypothetical protein
MLKGKILSAIILLLLIGAVQKASAAQNPIFPAPAQCFGADWNIGLPENTTCAGRISTAGALEQDFVATGVFGVPSRLAPNLVSLNQFCKEYTNDATALAIYGRMHRYCNSCDQNLSIFEGDVWTSGQACAGTLNVQSVTCGTNCVDPYVNSNSGEDCSTDSQCGTDDFIGGTFCQNGDVYRNYKTFTCNSPGTAQSSCSSATVPVLWYGCADNQTCNGGFCFDDDPPSVTCSFDSDCGVNHFIGDTFCSSNNVFKNYQVNTCLNPGTAQSSCSQTTVPVLWYGCAANQTCTGGFCFNNDSDDPSVTCNTNADCGPEGFGAATYCKNGDVYKDYKENICNNPGTAQSFCSQTATPVFWYGCSSKQTCSQGFCHINCRQ